MSYVFVPAAAQYGRRKGPVMAFVVHMAEGGGTVGFLSRPNIRGVSVHYVIEYSGRIVQMVRESDATGSINPNDLRTTDDPDGFYGVTAAKAVMGAWWRDPNSAAITLEIEGFAAAGPNELQRKSLAVLVNDVRSRYPSMGLLGHRDFTSRKACPGKLIPWSALGGHGPATGMEPSMIETIPAGVKVGQIVVNGADHSYLRLSDGTLQAVSNGFTKDEAIGPVVIRKGTILGDSLARRTGYVTGLDAAFFLGVDVTFTPADCSGPIAEALDLAAERAAAAVRGG